MVLKVVRKHDSQISRHNAVTRKSKAKGSAAKKSCHAMSMLQVVQCKATFPNRRLDESTKSVVFGSNDPPPLMTHGNVLADVEHRGKDISIHNVGKHGSNA